MHNHAFDAVQNTKAQKQIKNAPDKLSGTIHRKNKTKTKPLSKLYFKLSAIIQATNEQYPQFVFLRRNIHRA